MPARFSLRDGGKRPNAHTNLRHALLRHSWLIVLVASVASGMAAFAASRLVVAALAGAGSEVPFAAQIGAGLAFSVVGGCAIERFTSRTAR
ncbi:MAG: hypothetical protein HKP61_23155 [Dactylosporangium sp.]|nr:hypothetical protein [Dactylosporangium sp.]NNJ63778.1 hypothetical protein [Dactylosporangium sp.]